MQIQVLCMVYKQTADISLRDQYSPSANYIFGVLTCIAGFIAIPLGSVLSRFLERWTRKADALINATG